MNYVDISGQPPIRTFTGRTVFLLSLILIMASGCKSAKIDRQTTEWNQGVRDANLAFRLLAEKRDANDNIFEPRAVEFEKSFGRLSSLSIDDNDSNKGLDRLGRITELKVCKTELDTYRLQARAARKNLKRELEREKTDQRLDQCVRDSYKE